MDEKDRIKAFKAFYDPANDNMTCGEFVKKYPRDEKEQDEMEFSIGDLVETAVYILGKRIPMNKGRIISIHSGYCKVDIMSLHGGAPWIVDENTWGLRRVVDC